VKLLSKALMDWDGQVAYCMVKDPATNFDWPIGRVADGLTRRPGQDLNLRRSGYELEVPAAKASLVLCPRIGERLGHCCDSQIGGRCALHDRRYNTRRNKRERSQKAHMAPANGPAADQFFEVVAPRKSGSFLW
jgi:hypothetical protein